MPRVPRYGEPQVSRRPISGEPLRVPQEDVSGPYRAMEGIGESLGRMADREYAKELSKANALRDSEARRAINDWELANIHDPKAGAVRKLGKNAIGIGVDLDRRFQEFAKGYEKGLSTDEQRLAFRGMAEGRRGYIARWAMDHESQQVRVAQEAEWEAANESSKERASVDPSTAPLELAIIRDNVMARATDNGWSPEQTNQELRRQTSDLHARAISRMVSTDRDAEAMAHFQKVETGLDPDVATKLREMLKEATLRRQAQREADDILGYRPKTTPSGSFEVARIRPSLKEALAKAREIEDEKVRPLVEQLVAHDFRMQDYAHEDEQAALYEEAAKAVDASPGVPVQMTVPVAAWENLDSKYRDALERRVIPKDNDNNAWMEFIYLPHDELAKMKRADFEEKYWSRFDKEHRGRAETRLKEARDPKAEDVFKSLFSDQKMILRGLQEFGVAGIREGDSAEDVGNDSEKAEAYRTFETLANDAFKARFHETGKMPKDEEKQAIVDKIMLEQARKFPIRDRIWDWLAADEEKALGAMTPEQRAAAYVHLKDIPAVEIGKIKRQLAEAGRKYSEDKAIRLYFLKVAGDKEGYFEYLMRGN